MSRKLKIALSRAHREQDGAVIIMLLAAFLVLFMLSLVLYDAGLASRDKMKTQVAADTSAFAHSTVKARGMNMIVYGNIIKRVFYAYMHTYTIGWAALTSAFAVDDALCARLNVDACGRAAEELTVITAELAEAPSNLDALLNPEGRSMREIHALDGTQSYLAAITPWWAWVENFTRAYQNGAFVTMTWPPPSSDITAVKDFINRGAAISDTLLGSDIVRALPPNTYNTDHLPVARRDKDALLDRWKVKVGAGEAAAHFSYCGQYFGSFESLVLQAQYLLESADIWTMKAAFLVNVLNPMFGCLATGIVYGGEVLDYKIEGGAFGNNLGNAIGGRNGANDQVSDDWLTRTSNFTIAYKPRAGRMSDEDNTGRGKYGFVRHDYTGIGSTAAYRNSGYWAIARSELVYVPRGIVAGLSDIWGGLDAFGIDEIVDTSVRTPDMWTPAWTSRLRPAVLPGEQVATSTTDEAIGLEAMFWDSAAYFVMSSAVMGAVDEGIGDGQLDVDDAVVDLQFLLRATAGYGPDEMEGITK